MRNEAEPHPFYPDGTARLLVRLCVEPATDVRCVLDRALPAVAVYYTPHGCVARPNDLIQALCLQHIETDGISSGSRPILDLTAEEAWSAEAGLDLPLRLEYSVERLRSFLSELGIAQLDLGLPSSP